MKKLFPDFLKPFVKIVMHFLFIKKHNLKKVNTSFPLFTIKKQKYNTFFGYYDISPFNRKSQVVFLEMKDNRQASVALKDKYNSHQTRLITTTNACNWQQGSRLRWFPNSDDKIMFNDFIDDSYLCRIVSVNESSQRIINKPIYDISKDGNIGLSLNFERLDVMRPGYGYSCRKHEILEDLSEEGIDEINISTNTTKRLFTYKDIAAAIKLDKGHSFENNYINHISFSPSSEKFLFFWLSVEKSFHKASLIVYDYKSQMLFPLELTEKVSHYVWIDDNTILCTAFDENYVCRYYKYGLDGSKEHVCKTLLKDGHPSVIDENTILTDTYPDKNGFQQLLLVDINGNKENDILLSIYSTPLRDGERRTDLHPRLNLDKDMICFDSNISGYRRLNFLKTIKEDI